MADVKKIATRESYGNALVALGEKYDNLVVLDAGHDYTFGELGSEAYNWELESITVHPMLIDGVLTELTLVEGSTTCPNGETCYTVNGKLYKVSGNSPTITATNHRRSNINITKTVDGQSADPNQEFEFTIKITWQSFPTQLPLQETTGIAHTKSVF